MSATIITKNSSTASAVPAAGSLVQGELAVNVTDKKLYTKDAGGTVQKLVGSLGNQEANNVAITGGTANIDSLVADTADIDAGTIDNTVIGGTTPAAGSFTTLSTTGALTYGGVTLNNAVTGTGDMVLSTSPSLTTPNLGTPSAVTLTNATGLPVSTGISGLGSGVATFLATPSSANLRSAVTDETGSGALVFATSPSLTTPNLGTPSAVTLTNATGLPLTTGVTGTLPVANGGTGITSFGTGVATALGQNVTGSGGMVLATSPTLTTPNLGTPTAVTLTNATGLPISTGVSGLGTNVATALGVNVGTVGAFVVSGGALGTPSSGTVTNLTGTASININGTVGATTPAAGTFTTLTANGNTTLGDSTADTITATGRFNTDLVPSTDNARDLGTSALKWKQIYATTFTENGFGVVSQTDIGSGPNEIPLNQYLGALAYEDTETPALDVGTGITTGTGTICKANGGLMGGVYKMTILIDLTGLNSGGTAGDIIGVNGTALPCYIARLPAMTVLGGRMTCLETPAGGDTDIDLYSAAEGTGVEDQAITALTETEIINAGAQTRGTVTYFSADPAANAYFYLVGQGTANATYTAGRFLIEIFGV